MRQVEVRNLSLVRSERKNELRGNTADGEYFCLLLADAQVCLLCEQAFRIWSHEIAP